ncbi:MAG TPA: GNAT family N-acetyltransferase [Firmicutes bacterium]|nr:GNAT family N-acetyltransferase [Bacillota bacterium]
MVREARREDLPALLRLYAQLHAGAPPAEAGECAALWESVRAFPGCTVLVAEKGGKPVSTCTVTVIPNLTHGGRPYAVVENVVTDAAFRGRGLASACLKRAEELARQAGCYKMMLLTGSRQGSTLRFYERAGYNRTDKTGFVRWL